jgi:hypothetical protein
MIVDCEYHHMTERESSHISGGNLEKPSQFMESSIYHQFDRKY